MHQTDCKGLMWAYHSQAEERMKESKQANAIRGKKTRESCN